MPTLLHGPGCDLGEWYGMSPVVVHYRADLQSVHGLRCYGNMTRTRNINKYMTELAVCLVRLVSRPISTCSISCGFVVQQDVFRRTLWTCCTAVRFVADLL